MFSIIIPLYNKSAYIENAIHSVLSQTFQEFELIVVNDGSTDDSFTQVSVISYQLSVENPEQFKKIRIVDQLNQGVSTTRNNGVKLAKYDYIAFLDADDWWDSTYLEEMRNLIENYPEAGIFGSSYFKVKHGKLIPAIIGVAAGFEQGLINYCRVYAKTMYQPLWTGATVIKKEIFLAENGFKTNLKMGEDFDLWLRVALKYPVALLNKPLSYYNQDVDVVNRAIGEKLYEADEYMLFTDYGELNKNKDFRMLYEVLAVYGLLKYYLAGKSIPEVNLILKGIHWKNHAFKYKLYYKILPKFIVRFWMRANKIGSKIKKLVAGSKM